jgi:hypothetical protein
MSGRLREKDLGRPEHNMESQFFTQPSQENPLIISPARVHEHRYDTASLCDEYKYYRYCKGFPSVGKVHQDSIATR